MNIIKDLEQAIHYNDLRSVQAILSQDLSYIFSLLGKPLKSCIDHGNPDITRSFIEHCVLHVKKIPSHQKDFKIMLEVAIKAALLIPNTALVDMLYEDSHLYTREEIGYRLSREFWNSVEVGDELIIYLLRHPYVDTACFINSTHGQGFIRNCLYLNRSKSLIDIFQTPSLSESIKPFIKQIIENDAVFSFANAEQAGNVELLEYALDNLATHDLNEEGILLKIIQKNLLSDGQDALLNYLIIRQNYSQAFIIKVSEQLSGIQTHYQEEYQQFCQRLDNFYEKKVLHEKLQHDLSHSQTILRRKI